MNMTNQALSDRELLEYAAKAAKRDVIWKKGMFAGEAYEGLYDRQTGIRTTWNPLTNDGDAFRLMVKLQLEPSDYKPVFVEDKCPYNATRRAIVRAAAEIGRAKLGEGG